MNKHQITVSSVSIETDPELTLEELCSASDVTPEFIQQLIEYGILDLGTESLATYRFGPVDLRRVRLIAHLQHDLEVNLSGAAIVVDLLDEIEEMRVKIEILERQLYLL